MHAIGILLKKVLEKALKKVKSLKKVFLKSKITQKCILKSKFTQKSIQKYFTLQSEIFITKAVGQLGVVA